TFFFLGLKSKCLRYVIVMLYNLTYRRAVCPRSLANVSELLYTTSDPVDTQYVAANDPRVSTVAVVITTASKQEAGGRLRLMLVGRGYTSRGPGDVPPVTARRLAPTPPPRLAFSQEEELGKLVVGSYSEYNNRFVYAFRHGAHAYFLLARRDTRHRKEYLSFVARLCVSDRGFYSYVELPLLCKGGYNLARGARLAPDLARPALFITMAKGQASTPVATDHSALCVYGMAELDEMLSRTQEVCYSQEGRGSSGLEEAYIEYAVSSVCLRLPAVRTCTRTTPAGGAHPQPIASSIPLPATPTITMTTQLTAITTATEAGHTIALLGDKEGNLHKVLVGSDWSGKLYDSVQVDQGSEVRELLLDRTREHAYVLTSSKVSRLPVAWCERKTGCQACLSLRDPYCGWCVLEGKCSRQHECSRNSSNHWLWSFETTNQCVSIQSLEPANQSRDVCMACVSSVWECNWCPLDQTCSSDPSCQHALHNHKVTTPPIATPSITTPSVATPSVATPSITTPLIATPSITTPPIATPLIATPPYSHAPFSPPHTPYSHTPYTHAPYSHTPYSHSPFSHTHTLYTHTLYVVGEPCTPKPDKYLISTRIVCELQPAVGPKEGPVLVTVGTHRPGRSSQLFTYRDPQVVAVVPSQGPVSGGTLLTIQGQRLLTGLTSDLTAYVGLQPCSLVEQVSDSRLVCRTGPSEGSADVPVRIVIGRSERTVADALYRYLDDPVITDASPSESFYEYIMCTMSIVQYITRWKINNQKLLSLPLSLSPSLPLSLCTLMSPSLPLSLRGYISLPLSLPLSLRGYISLPLSPHLPLWGSLSQGQVFSYHPNPELFVLNRETPDGVGLTRAVSRGEVVVRLGDEECEVKTLDDTHLYCEPPEEQPSSLTALDLPSLTVGLGNLQVDLGVVQYDSSPSPIPLAAQLGLGAGAAVVVLSVLVVILMYRRKSKQALRDYKKVLLQLETLEINVGDQCRKEFTDLMTDMTDLTDSYAQRVFFPGQQGALLSQKLDVPETRRAAVEQGLSGLHKLLNNKAFLIKFIHTLEAQQGFSQRDRGYVASLLTVALHDKLEYFTEVMKTLLQHLVLQYASKNPKLMLRRTETVVEKMLTNWMSICLYSFLKVAGEPLYMLFRAIKYQVDKGPVDAVTGRAKRTLNDSHLLREDIDYRPMVLNLPVCEPVCLSQVKEKILDQTYKGAAFSQRPSAHALDLEWRSGQAGHLTLSDDDVTAIVQGRWKKLNTLQHYKVPDGATVALIPASQASTKGSVHQVYQTAEKTPILEEEEEVRLWHLVKSSEEPDAPRRSSMRERERAKAIPEIYLTRLLSMKGTLQKFVDDVFVAILNTKRPPPIAVRFFFDFLDDMAEKHAIDDPETVHIWKTNSLPLRFWVNILKNPQFVFDVQVTDSIDAVLSVIAQTFIDSCTTSEHKVGRDSPVNKLLYAREIPRYKQMVERYYSDIHSAASGCYQEMNSTLTGLSGMSSLVALHELYKYINKYYDKVMSSLDEDSGGQKMQLAYRLQQVAALLENKVTDL
uniref:Plexin B3 n=1 Tax=Gadus morhua TaxID=8049 RepID=A0A8C5ABY0_GADMO